MRPLSLFLACLLSAPFALFSETPSPAKKKTPSAAPQTNAAASTSTAGAATSVPVPETLHDEIYKVLQSRYASPSALTPQRMNQAAVEGMLSSLEGSATVITPEAATPKPATTLPSPNSVAVINPFIGYLRLDAFREETPAQFSAEVTKLIKNEHASGLILDLRFAQNDNYGIVPAIASALLPTARPLYTIQRGSVGQDVTATADSVLADIPLIVLVNRETRGAPELLAAVLQNQGAALIMGGSATAGRAYETSDFKLSNGQILRFATGKFILPMPRGGELFLRSVAPDVNIRFDLATEKEIHTKPFQVPEMVIESRFYSEAILTGREAPPSLNKKKSKKDPPESPSNKDLVLLRAMDLIKSIRALDLSTSSNRLAPGPI